MVNATQYRKHAIKANIPYMLALKRYWKPMLGTCKYILLYTFIPFAIL
jgi:hypothetical protein